MSPFKAVNTQINSNNNNDENPEVFTSGMTGSSQ
jgi:hypothetical protein